MKVKVLTRNPDEYMRETKKDIHKVPRNYDPALHPFEAQREYTRAVNAVKLERIFAKPFVGSLDGHRDGISILGKHPKSLSCLASGSFDGEVRLWNLPTKKCVRSIAAHDGIVRGIDFVGSGEQFLTVGDDKTVKSWHTQLPSFSEDLPINTVISKTVLTGISCNKKNNTYATCGELCLLWELGRNEPIRSLKWGVDSLQHVAFNPVEENVLATCASDRSIILYDTREPGPVRKMVLEMRSNQLAWNPMEAYTFTVANEDYNLYTFDTRCLFGATQIHKGHVSAVISVDYSPTGLEIVSGSYDKTLRIFSYYKNNSRDVYHTKRMQRITNVAWSLDNKYVISASDEMNIRLWKAKASEKLGVMTPREKVSQNYNAALLRKFESFPQIKRIARHRQVPKHVFNATREHRAIHLKQKIKESNKRAHSKPGTVPHVSLHKKSIVEVKE
ncbi:hypothetical protein AAG570_002149 [Ranatra chinensis]|uniref:DDB1- and CUL4-associated factor 13 n=1 Tax=Ranatra chinensis TaxID=642074 RepID=A0ABD0Y6M9_9HEMI